MEKPQSRTSSKAPLQPDPRRHHHQSIYARRTPLPVGEGQSHHHPELRRKLSKFHQSASSLNKLMSEGAEYEVGILEAEHSFICDKIESLKEKECINQQEMLIPLEQVARQKVTELLSVLDAEKSQGSVLKAVLQAKESKEIDGIYGRPGDLGAIELL